MWFRPLSVTQARGAGIDNYMQSQSPDPLTGQTIAGKYRVVARLGAGGMGVLYKAISIQLDKPVALKMVHRNLVGQGTNLQRLRREANVLASLNHPNIVSINAIDVDDQGQCLVAMEYLDGINLEQHLQQSGPLTRNQFSVVFEQVCSALSYAHAHGIIHRDLKPSNLMLLGDKSEAWSVKVVDFGLARLADESTNQKLTSTGALLGSANYMSPEQCQGGMIDQRSDIYSLACVMHQALTGQPPFAAETPFAIIFKHANETLPALSDPKLKALSSVLTLCTSIDPSDRLASVDAMWQAIQSESMFTTKRVKAIQVNHRLALAACCALLIVILGVSVVVMRPSTNFLPGQSNRVSDPTQLNADADQAKAHGDLKSFETYAEKLSQLPTSNERVEEQLATDYYELALQQPEGSSARQHLTGRMLEHMQNCFPRVHETTSPATAAPLHSAPTYQLSNDDILNIPATMLIRLEHLHALDSELAERILTDQIRRADDDRRMCDSAGLRVARGELRYERFSSYNRAYTQDTLRPIEDDMRGGFLDGLRAQDQIPDEAFAYRTASNVMPLCTIYMQLGRYNDVEEITNLWLTEADKPRNRQNDDLSKIKNLVKSMRKQAELCRKQQVPNGSSDNKETSDKK